MFFVHDPILLQNVSVGFGRGSARALALDGVSFSAEANKVTMVMGPSGSGKTTLLSLAGCLLSPDRGTVRILDTDVGKLSEKERATFRQINIGFVFQSFRLFKALSAAENVAIVPRLAGQSLAKSQARAMELIQEMGLGDKAHLRPDELSGGEKQRVAVARAIANRPTIILADEPTASLDAASGIRIGELFQMLAKELGHTVVVVTHDPRITQFSDKCVQIVDGKIRK